MNDAARRKTFRAALALAGMTQAQWAEAQGVTEGHLSHVLNKRRISKKLLKAVEDFTRDTFNRAIKGMHR
jgi:transcriptional regulator with XRE-family HTH domain